MENIILGSLCILASFFLTLFLTKYWIKVARKADLVGKDMNKYDKRKVPEAGGVAVIFSFSFALLLYIFLKVFIFETETHLILILALLASMLMAGFLGFIDDVLGWLVGLKQWHKVLLTLPIAIPIIVVNAGHSTINIPFLSEINLGLFYPLVIVPLAIIGSANGYNMLAGYNGLEAGLGTIILGTLGLVSLRLGNNWLALICFVAVAALLAFLLFNWYPARVFPGDSLTYAIGALIAIIAILGNMEKLALFLFIPFFIDAVLYFKARVIDKAGYVQAFGKPNKDGTLEMPYRKIYDSTHLAIMLIKRIKKKVYERDVVVSILALEAILAVLSFALLT